MWSLKQFDYDWNRRDKQIKRTFKAIRRLLNCRQLREELGSEERKAWEKYEETRTITWKQEELDELGYTLRTTVEAKITTKVKKIKKVKKPIVKGLCDNCGIEILKWRKDMRFCDYKCKNAYWKQRYGTL